MIIKKWKILAIFLGAYLLCVIGQNNSTTLTNTVIVESTTSINSKIHINCPFHTNYWFKTSNNTTSIFSSLINGLLTTMDTIASPLCLAYCYITSLYDSFSNIPKN
ncbi:Hypothetical protein SRAE_2000356300 [Strongyloides ratti]|uniref:Uncharacterized protein n=1 Tax=Strongyloides ratti TaxID=34506 RepID=A0A090MZG8_STRRB|nr:Hypothetical protein SRAE_2000356300 [Strongyloides ratti]CEF68909.1 Hypothetical protein SRAE_2000356300 [Strongyloides ratti]